MARIQASVIAVLSLACLAAVAVAEPKPVWLGGTIIASRGFSADTGFAAGEYLEIGAFLDPMQAPAFDPILSMTVLLPLFPFDPSKALVGANLDLVLMSLKRHPFSGVVDQANRFCPSIGASWYFRPGSPLADGWLFLTAYPLRLRTGDALYSLLAPEWLLRGGSESMGWGLRVFEFAYFWF